MIQPSIDVLCKGKRPVWGDDVVVQPCEVVRPGREGAEARPAVAGRVRHLGTHVIQVGDQEFGSGRISYLEVVREVAAEVVMEHLRPVGANLAVTSTWHGPGTAVIWAAHWKGVEVQDRGVLHQAIAFGHTPEEALRDLWWLVTTQARLVRDAYGVRGARTEFRWDGLEGRWVNLDAPTGGE